ncbi:LPXTG cell wall anchor domain-containing protein [Leucobacter sp. USCH14]|uniref:LPXTG cell wall anchor domain-containing protein n=1 Tax=Leucobacter sp. USCH14 TaxID=3024838 RepID=UPI0030B2FABB
MKFSKKLAGAAAIGAIAALTFGGTAATAVEPGDPITLAPQPTLGAAEFTVSGETCLDEDGTPGTYLVAIAPAEGEEPEIISDVAGEDGSWSATLATPAESGVYEVVAACDLYAGITEYASADLLVSAEAGVQLAVAQADHFESFGFTGAGFTPGENVRVEFRQNGEVVESLGTVLASAVGEIAGDITLGNTLAYGEYDVYFVGETSGTEYSAPLTVTDGTVAPTPTDPGNVGGGVTPTDPVNYAPGAKLANTGGENLAPFAIAGGVAALALGAGALALGRRKARAAE